MRFHDWRLGRRGVTTRLQRLSIDGTEHDGCRGPNSPGTPNLVELMMTILDCETTFQGGIRRLDAEHRKQVYLIQQIGEREATMIELLGNLYASYTKHFAYEEAIMRAQCYDGYEEHQADHQRLLDEITKAMFHYRSGGRRDSANIAKGLAESFRNHLLHYDQHRRRQTNSVTNVV